jgi:hypothetical protein
MFDSVAYYLGTDQFLLKPNNKLDGRKTQRGRGFQINSSYCDEYRRQLKKSGIYCPDIRKVVKTFRNSPAKEVLEITASYPKLKYGTNAFEIDSSDIPKCNEKLLYRLDDMGISTSKSELRQAIIKRVDYSKIIILPPYLGKANRAVYALSGFDHKPRSDANFNKFNDGNGGTSIKFWNSTQGYVIYDVIGNILSHGYTKTEKTIIAGFKSGQFKRTPIKFELSLQRKDSFEALIRRRIKNTEKKRDFCLKDIANEDLAKDILLNAFDNVFNNVAVGLLTSSEMKENRLRAYLDNSGISIKQQEQLYYWVRMATNFGLSGTWEQIKLKYKGGSIARIKKEVALTLQELGEIDSNALNLIKFLRNEHEKFDIIKPKKLSTCQPLLNKP